MNNDINYDVNDAMKTGISGEAVSDTIEEVLDKSNDNVPKQFKDTIEVVADMKSDKQESFNQEYASNLVQNNSNRIKEALKDGIEPNEVATEIAKNSMSANTPDGYKKLSFIARLISKMKRKQRKKEIQSKQQEIGGNQKVYTYTDNNNQN